MNGFCSAVAVLMPFVTTEVEEWRSFQEDIRSLTSLMDNADGEFAVYHSSLDSKMWTVETRSWGILRANGRCSIVVGDSSIPQMWLTDHGFLWLTKDAEWKSWKNPEWSFSLNPNRAERLHQIGRVDGSSSSRVRLELQPILETFSKKDFAEHHYLNGVVEVQAGHFGPTLILRRHTPNDQSRVGTPISSIEFTSENRQTKLEIRGFRFQDLSKPDFYPDLDTLTNLANAERADSLPNLEWKSLIDLKMLSSAGKLNRLELPSRQFRQCVEDLRMEVFSAINDASTLSKDGRRDRVFQFLPSIVSAMGVLQNAIADRRLKSDLVMPDDSALQWRVSLRHVDAVTLRTLFNTIAPFVFSRKKLSTSEFELVVQFTVNLARFGRPPFPPALNILDSRPGSGDAVFRAILRSSWDLPCKEEDLRMCGACTTKSASFPALSDACSNVLIRSGNPQMVGEAGLDLWWQNRISAKSQGALFEALSKTSLNSAGRGVLLEQYSQAAPKIRSVIKTILAERVTATRKLKRWDFMTQEEISSVESSIGRVNRD